MGEDGATHQCNEDIALMRTIPGMTVICPSDDVEAKAAVKAAYEHDGPVYLRFGRLPVPVINDTDDYHFELGKGITLREGTDLTIVSTGLCVPACLDAARALERDGISAGVINIHTIKPIDEGLPEQQAAKRTGKVVTVEEHSVIGGLEAPSPTCSPRITRYRCIKSVSVMYLENQDRLRSFLKSTAWMREGIEVKIRIWLSSGDNL